MPLTNMYLLFIKNIVKSYMIDHVIYHAMILYTVCDLQYTVQCAGGKGSQICKFQHCVVNLFKNKLPLSFHIASLSCTLCVPRLKLQVLYITFS